MKYFLLIIALILSGCAEKNIKQNKKSGTTHRQSTKMPAPEPQIQTFEETVGEAYTEIYDRNSNRVSNIIIACSTVHGTEIQPGTIFSFNETVGKRSISRGYKEAGILVDGKHKNGIGGGVCQLSSTIYMAALNCGFDIKERHRHSVTVAYAPDGNDATVSYGSLDMKFVNTSQDNVILYTWVENNKVYAKFVKIITVEY